MKRPNALYHFSEAPVEVFGAPNTVFKVKTQGRVYALSDPSSIWKTTKAVEVQSVLVFIEDALINFERHPILTLLFFKRLYGQYWTKEMGDLSFQQKDVFISGNVVVITSCKIIPINDLCRSWSQYLRVQLRKFFDFFVFELVFLLLLLGVLLRMKLISINVSLNRLIDHTCLWLGICIFGIVVVVASIVSNQISRKNFNLNRFDTDIKAALELARTRNTACCLSTIWHTLRRLGLTHKKTA